MRKLAGTFCYLETLASAFPGEIRREKYAEREIYEIYGWQKRRGPAGEDVSVGFAGSYDYYDVYPSVVGIFAGAGGIDLLLFSYDEQKHFQALSGESAFPAENLQDTRLVYGAEYEGPIPEEQDVL